MNGERWLRLRRLVDDERGQDLIEYALLGAFIAIVSVAALRVLGTTLAGFYAQVSAAFQ